MGDIGNRSIFGELALLFEGPRTATVRTYESSHVLVIPAATFNSYMRKPLLKKLNVILQFYRSLSFFDSMDISTLLILASKTFITGLQSHTLIVRQDNKSKYIYFIRKGRVKIIRSIEVVDCSKVNITIENYQTLFREPDEKHRLRGLVKSLPLEVTELGLYECFGEDIDMISNSMLTPEQISSKPLPYSVISSMPLECYSLRKKDFYEYISDTIRKSFLKYLKPYPKDQDLRRFYYEQINWMEYRL